MGTKFELRTLKSSDMFPMFSILSKIGVKDLKETLNPEELQKMISSANSEDKDDDSKATIFGFNIILDIVGIIMKNLPSCEKEIYSFLASISGMTVKQISDLSMVDFTEMIVAVVQKDEFKDFFKVVSGLFK